MTTEVEVTAEHREAAHAFITEQFEGIDCEHGEDDDWCTHLAQLLAARDREAERRGAEDAKGWEQAALAYEALNVVYRTGGRPSEALFARLDKAREFREQIRARSTA